MEPLPTLTSDLPGTGGRIKASCDDFRVDEIQAEAPSGRGRYAWFLVTKRGVTTPAAVQRIARFAGVPASAIGFAGLKDARAVTRQWMSLEYGEIKRLKRFADAEVRIEQVGYHNRPLHTGDLVGNRFVLRIRDVDPASLPLAEAVLAVLRRRGVPNAFGPQRFGPRGDTALLGAALVQGRRKQFVQIFLGGPLPDDPPPCRAAREAFDAGRLDQAMRHWPMHFTEQRKALAAYRRRRSGEAAIATLDARSRRFFIYAFQSAIFNRVLGLRMDTIDRLAEGDIAEEAATGRTFPIADPAKTRAKVEALHLHPTGPLVGGRAILAEGQPGRIERKAIERFGLKPDDLARLGRLIGPGGRRALRYRLEEPSLAAGRDGAGDYLKVRFAAPSGCYATSVLREIMKDGAADTAEGSD